MSQNLRGQNSSTAYARLSEFATRHRADTFGPRARLALGYHDYNLKRFTRARRSLGLAEHDPLLREYACYWGALATRAEGRLGQAVTQLEAFRRGFPDSVMTEAAVAALAETSLEAGQPRRALAALEPYEKATARSPLLLLRAQALARAGWREAAAGGYLAIYYGFPLTEEAKTAGQSLRKLSRMLGPSFPVASIEQRLSRAAALYEGRRWRDARADYSALLESLAGVERARAELRVAQCRVQITPLPAILADLKLTDAELDAERLYALSQVHRTRNNEAAMLDAVEQAAARHPESRWTEEALFAAGNHFWVALNRARAAEYYRRVLARFPESRHALASHWRAAWVAYLERREDRTQQLEEHIRRFPASPHTSSALYWLGRAAEGAGNDQQARSFYLKLLERFPQTYYGRQAAERFRVLGPGPADSLDLLALVASPGPLPALDEAIPPAAGERWGRAQALRSIAFHASAELELRAAYALTSSPRLLLEAAEAAVAAGRYPEGISAARQVYPQLEARRLEEVPEDVWRTVYPFDYQSGIEESAARAGLDPMLVAGLIRQESIFLPTAVSRSGAVGIMQVMPKTGRRLARSLGLRYSRARLLSPDYNVRLGTTHLARLLENFGRLEFALAAYNAGEHRVTAWQAAESFQEPAEFVESIPFTETREYVQVVIRNAEIYRRVYGNGSRPGNGSRQ